MSTGDPFQKFRELLEHNHQFPTEYHHKFIGKNSPMFLESVAEFEKKHIGLKLVSRKESAKGAHISLSFDYHAANVEEVVELLKETQKINDLIFII